MLALSAALLLAAAPPSSLQFWSDGQAELSGYHSVRDRYGELRQGTTVLIFVKEPFSDALRVKADPGKHPASDVFDVLKLNHVEKFQTGIYDYALMTSSFAAFAPRGARRAGALAKIAFSSQEWCGAMFEELLFDPDGIRQKRFSYFDGEADQEQKLAWPPDGITVDELPILVRSIPAPFLERGEKKSLPILPSLTLARLLHQELGWQPGSIERGKDAQEIEVPAGRFTVEAWTVRWGKDQTIRYSVEAAHPHRVIAWSGPGKNEGKLAGSARLKYWELQSEGHEKHLAELGLAPKSLRK